MKIAYLFFAYRNPKLISRIIDRLSGENSVFFLHLDAKSDLREFLPLKDRGVIFVEPRIRVSWGEFSGIRAILQLIRAALSHPAGFDYLVLLSGSEYPLHSRKYIEEFLEAHRGTEFMSMVEVPNAAAGKPVSRISRMWIPSERPVLQFVVKVLARLGLARRDYRRALGTLKPYAGHTWWTLTREACQYISDFVERNPRVARFFENTFAPEESFFQTILGNSPFRSRARRNLVFEDWSARGGHPAMISDAHMAEFAAQGRVFQDDAYGPGEVLWARKFSDADLRIVERLEEAMQKRQGRELSADAACRQV